MTDNVQFPNNPSIEFTEKSLPLAIGKLLEMNNYDVKYDVHVHGAQIDIVAQSKTDPFANTLYIEATIEYVSTEKYGKDTTKFILLKNKMPGAWLLCISSKGFTAPVAERAVESGITALSYDELFKRFEKFDPYITKIHFDQELAVLDRNYEEPLFSDNKGVELATPWLDRWRISTAEDGRWLIILGEYGTGKTALTKILQRRWAQSYKSNTSMPIPIRIELRNFYRQFDARSLLHHFLDKNSLGHVPVDFLFHLIKNNRVVLILDGYDEMAQFMNARERRACLSALAELSADGARGILTSRPNYFTEAEELSVFQALYTTIEHNKHHISQMEKEIVAEEKAIDALVENYVLERYERNIQDLTPEQTESLVKRNLDGDEQGQAIVISLLNRVFKSENHGRQRSLSGKPVIISYILEIIEELRKSPKASDFSEITEWEIYKMIVDMLMFRDIRRSPLNPKIRRIFLQKLAVTLSGRNKISADEGTFYNLIEEEFKAELRRSPPEERRARKVELYEDLRSSATLTRQDVSGQDGFAFSHNSLREYLSSEIFINNLLQRSPIDITIPVTPVMREFVGSMTIEDRSKCWQILLELWPQRATHYRLGPYLSLLWEVAAKNEKGILDSLFDLSHDRSEDVVNLSDISLRQIDLSASNGVNKFNINASNSEMDSLIFDGVNLSGSDFKNSVLDSVSFKGCDLNDTKFVGSLIYECDFSNTTVSNANFENVENDISIYVYSEETKRQHLVGMSAIGYLRYHGAVTNDVDNYSIYMHHNRFPILVKIMERLKDQRNSQLRGLTQRGEAHIDPPFARSFITKLQSLKYIEIERNSQVSATPLGRNMFSQFFAHRIIPQEISDFLSANR